MPSRWDSPEAYDVFLWHLVRCPEVAKQAIDRQLDWKDFNGPGLQQYQIVWRTSLSHWEKLNAIPPVDLFIADAIANCREGDFQSPELEQLVVNLIHKIFAVALDQVMPVVGHNLLQSFLHARYLREMDYVRTLYPNDVDKINSVMNDHYKRAAAPVTQTMNPFDVDAHVPDFPPRKNTFVSFINTLLGGGVLDGEVYGVLGPTGGGKTTLAIQWGVEMAKGKNHVMYLTVEEGLSDGGSLQARALSYGGAIDIRTMRGKKFEDMDPTTQKRIRNVQEQCGDYFEFIDMSAAGGSVAGISSMIESRARAGRKPQLVILDWLLPFVTRVMETSKSKSDVLRHFVQSVMDGLLTIAKEQGVCFLILHQLSVAQSSKSATARPNWFNSAEAGSFAWLLHNCMAIGTADSKNVAIIVASKVRGDAKGEVWVKLNGRYSRFDSLDGKFKGNQTGSDWAVDGELGKVPRGDEDEEKDDAEETDKRFDDKDVLEP